MLIYFMRKNEFSGGPLDQAIRDEEAETNMAPGQSAASKERIKNKEEEELKKLASRGISDGQLLEADGEYVLDKGSNKPRLEVSAGSFIELRKNEHKHHVWGNDILLKLIKDLQLERRYKDSDLRYNFSERGWNKFFRDEQFWEKKGCTMSSYNHMAEIPLEIRDSGIQLKICYDGSRDFEIREPRGVRYGLNQLNDKEINEFTEKLRGYIKEWADKQEIQEIQERKD